VGPKTEGVVELRLRALLLPALLLVATCAAQGQELPARLPATGAAPLLAQRAPWVTEPAQAQATAFQPGDRGQRVRELEGLGPAPGTTAEQEDSTEETLSDKPTVDWSGELQADTVMVDQTATNQAVLGDLENFSDFRRARLAAQGNLYANTLYRIEVDFAQQGRPTFLDVYGQITDLPVIENLRIGHFFEPFSISRLTSNRYQTFMERPLLDAFAPVRNLGVMAFRTYADKHGTWALGGFAGETNDVGEQQSDAGGESITGRITFLPFWYEANETYHFMHLGACYSSRWYGSQTARFGYWPGARPGSFDNIFWPRWADTGAFAAESANLFDLEWAWVRGRWHAQAEWATTLVNQPGGPNLQFSAWYLETGFFLTGESRPYLRETAVFNRVTPRRPFVFRKSGLSGIGAWQVAFRLDDLDVTDNSIQGGRLVDLTVGLNWHLNPYTKMYVDYIHPFLTRGAPGRSEGNLVAMRAQFEF
jgi:phosphate-selective porin OprO/OprP